MTKVTPYLKPNISLHEQFMKLSFFNNFFSIIYQKFVIYAHKRVVYGIKKYVHSCIFHVVKVFLRVFLINDNRLSSLDDFQIAVLNRRILMCCGSNVEFHLETFHKRCVFEQYHNDY